MVVILLAFMSMHLKRVFQIAHVSNILLTTYNVNAMTTICAKTVFLQFQKLGKMV
jgi:hypothetical protein